MREARRSSQARPRCPSASATRAWTGVSPPARAIPARAQVAPAARERVERTDRAGSGARRERHRDPGRLRVDGGAQEVGVRVPGPGAPPRRSPRAPSRTAASSAAPSVSRAATTIGTGRAAAAGIAGRRRRGPRVRRRTAARPQPPERRPVARRERVDGAGVALRHDVGGVDAAAKRHDDAGAARRRRRRDPDRAEEVRGPVPAGLARVAHRPGHDDGPLVAVAEVPGEGRLLEGVGPLHDDDAVDRRVGQGAVDDAAGSAGRRRT